MTPQLHCALCERISHSPPGSCVRLHFKGTERIVSRSHSANWPGLTTAEQFQMLEHIGSVFGASNADQASVMADLIDGHFHLRVDSVRLHDVSSGERLTSRIITGGGADPLFHHLVRHIDGARQVDLAVAFALQSGVALLEPYLEDLLARGGEVRLVVGDYFDVTEPSALRRLMDLEGGIEQFVYESSGGSFHPKAWVFRGADGAGSAIVGSSNLTRTALTDGVEWNLQSGPFLDDWAHVHAAFETLLSSPNVKPLTQDWIDRYAGRRKTGPLPVFAKSVAAESPPEPVPDPHEIQSRALKALVETRRNGNRAGLVILATGLGKTWLAAFDSVDFSRVLFVAHREEILAQAMHTFRRIRPDGRFGRYTGESKEEGDILFASIQTLGRREHLEQFEPGAFDYIVMDEFHHASAPSYRDLLNHFRPQFLLGLTATPERTDGGDLLELCGENLVFQCDLSEGIGAKLLVPFHYFGVPDEIDYEQIPWRNARFDPEALTAALATQKRAENALAQYRRLAAGPTLAFCCSRLHANFMAAYCNAAGLRAVAVHSGADSAPRTSSLEALNKGALDILFTVDMLNEGVDLPQIGTVMMLRPTESTIIFLQQLGRGLRQAPGKTHLQVIDYIGNHRSFLTKARGLLGAGDGDRSISRKLDDLEKGAFDLPEGCSITYELQALEFFKAMLRERGNQNEAEAFYRQFKLTNGVRPRAEDMARADFNPSRTGHGSWFEFVRDMGDEIPDVVMTTHGDLLRMISIVSFPGVVPLLVLKVALKGISSGMPIKRLHGGVDVLAESWPGLGDFDDDSFVDGLRFWLMTPHFTSDAEKFNLTRADPTGILADLLGELVDWRMSAFAVANARGTIAEPPGANWNAGPILWESYMREDIAPMFGATFSTGSWNAGARRQSS
jgi:superfamily II DNA or RNA helicase/HKD family nuclease